MTQDELSSALSLIIREAVTWCFHKPFRSPALDPFSILDVPDWRSESEPFEPWVERRRASYRRAILWINETRSELLKESKIETLDAADVFPRCRILVYWPLETVEDGASEAGSMGFYDMRDAPPWDTWFFYADDGIFCAVPDFATGRAQDGIDGNPVACIEWSDLSRLARIEKGMVHRR